jgi:cobyrinic acid a,c-diamide synthase
MSGVIIAAPQSNSGKTVVTLGLLRRLRNQGVRVGAAKAGPDYIDPGFLAAACGAPCRNLDVWAMRRATLAAQIAALQSSAEIILCEGTMGLFDGAGLTGRGSTADLAALTGWKIILVVSLEGQAASSAALIEGFARHRRDVTIGGVIFNRVASRRHAAMAEAALRQSLPEMRVLGAVSRDASLALPSRHLGLVPSGEQPALDTFLERAAVVMGDAIDSAALRALTAPASLAPQRTSPPLPTLGARIAIAKDDAFVFAYDGVTEGWRADGAELCFFSPLKDEAPPEQVDAIYLPGGYPELHAGRIANNRRFLDGLRKAAHRGVAIYGECGGYMVLGRGLVDADGTRHAMAGLLPAETSFAERKLHLCYRAVTLASDGVLGRAGQAYRAHEFHYATVMEEGAAPRLFSVIDADETALGSAGCAVGRVAGSFIHLIDRV